MFISESPLVEAIVGGVFVALPVVFVNWLQGRDVRATLATKVESHDKRLDILEPKVDEVEQKVANLRGHLGLNGGS